MATLAEVERAMKRGRHACHDETMLILFAALALAAAGERRAGPPAADIAVIATAAAVDTTGAAYDLLWPSGAARARKVRRQGQLGDQTVYMRRRRPFRERP